MESILSKLSENDLMNCVNRIAKQKGKNMETYLDDILFQDLQKLKFPLGISGKPVYPENKVLKVVGDDIYVPGLSDKLMLGQNYSKFNGVSKRNNDYPTVIQNKIPPPPISWYMSEKYDGQRALWDGSKFITRGSGTGNPRVYPYVPIWIIALMPPGICLDGEFFTKRDSFQELGFLRSKLKESGKRLLDKKWENIKYQVFDIITPDLFEARQKMLKTVVSERCKTWSQIPLPPYISRGECPLVFTEQLLITSEEKMNEYYNNLVSNGAEGVMIRAPRCPYIPRRTWLMLKLKPEEDSECTIIGYKPGEGKYSGMLGAFHCNDPSKGNFYIAGMTDDIRKNYLKTHPIGTKITYLYTFLTDSGLPRHPRYKGIPGDR